MSKRLNFLLLSLILSFPIFINSIKIIGNAELLIIFFIGLVAFLKKNANPFKIFELRVFSFLTFGYFLAFLIPLLWADGLNTEWSHLGRKLHFLLAPIIALAIFNVEVNIIKLLAAIKIGLITIGVIVLIQFFDGSSRPSGMINANIFNDIAVIMFFMSLVRIYDESLKEKIFTFTSSIFGLIAIILPSSRGSWLSFFILLFIFFSLMYYPRLEKFRSRKIIAISLILVSFLFVVNNEITKNRIEQANSEISNWSEGNGKKTSLGLRLEMWVAGLNAAIDSPLMGYGYRNANEISSQYAKNNQEYIKNFTHLHNEYITTFVSSGLIGLIGLMSLLIVPFVIFLRGLKNNFYLSVMGILLCSAYASFGFSHIAFGEEHINAYFIFFLALLLPRVISNNYLDKKENV